jgi:hypothetical protein
MKSEGQSRPSRSSPRRSSPRSSPQFLDSTDVVGPDPTQGGNNPIADWDGGAFASPNQDDVGYDIILTGTTPEPATWIMTGVAGLFLVLLRRAFTATGSR